MAVGKRSSLGSRRIGRALEWTPPERLEEGGESREVRSHSRPAGLVVHVGHGSVARTVLLGTIDEAVGEPRGWLDGLDPDEGMDRIGEPCGSFPWVNLMRPWPLGSGRTQAGS